MMSSEEDPVNESESMNSNSHVTDEEMFDKESDNSGANYLNADCLEVKLEIEGKEEADEFSSEIDFNGRLQFVNFDPQVPTDCNSVNPEHSGIPEWNYAQSPLPSSTDIQDAGIMEQPDGMHVYKQLENVPCDITKDIFVKQESSESSSASTIPNVYEPSLNSNWTNETYISSQSNVRVKNTPKKRGRGRPSSGNAARSRRYRKKMKEDNPDMWASMKRLEACRKREQKEEKRLILFEMEKTKALLSDCDPCELASHIARLQALKDKYPDLWLQLENDRPTSDSNCQGNSQEKNLSLKMRWRSLSEAEKKRYYRQKIKEENPELWSAIKLKDACKKREQREEKRLILLEMQKTMHLISHTEDPKDVEDHKAHLQSLKDKYPELWIQLEDAITATEMRSRNLFLEGEGKNRRRLTKPVQMYKDVVEAHKKFLYRQRLKEERPELYAQMRARDTYAKSIRRMMMKTGSITNSGMFSNCYQWVNIPETKEYAASIVLNPLHETEHI